MGQRGRQPLGAHTRRRSGCSPMRCSSKRQTATSALGWAAFTAAICSGSVFFELLLLFCVGLHMVRTRHLRRVTEPLQVVPAALRRHRLPDLLAYPAGHFGTAPEATSGR